MKKFLEVKIFVNNFWLNIDEKNWKEVKESFHQSSEFLYECEKEKITNNRKFIKKNLIKNNIHIVSNEVFKEIKENHYFIKYYVQVLSGSKVNGIYKVTDEILNVEGVLKILRQKILVVNELISSPLIFFNGDKKEKKSYEKSQDKVIIKRNTIRPKRIILLRHGESQGNVDKKVYANVPDNKIQLTEKGKIQAKLAGETIKKLIKNESHIVYLSPFIRTQQTFENFASAWGGSKNMNFKIDPRLREQEWGNYQDPKLMDRVIEERRQVGSFYYRFPTGESGADVYERVCTFIGSLHRSFKKPECRYDNIILISHGLTCRLFLMKWFRWSIETFHNLWNFDNCQHAIMERQEESGFYKLT